MISNLGNTLTNLTWSEMNRISVHISDATNDHFRNEEIVDPHFFSDLLVKMGQGILDELENLEAAKVKQGT